MPTMKQKKAFKEVLNGSTISGAMLEAGYSETTATTTKGWQELMDEHLPDDVLAKVHREGLMASKNIYKNNNESGEIENVGQEPDYSVRHKYLDSAYKLKGSYAAEKTTSLNLNIDARTSANPELEAIRQEFIDKLKDKLTS
jgi:hypothetical protein